MANEVDYSKYPTGAYPKVKYHKDHGAYTVHNAADEATLMENGGWHDTPAAWGHESCPGANSAAIKAMGFDPLAKKTAQVQPIYEKSDEPVEEPMPQEDEAPQPRRRR